MNPRRLISYLVVFLVLLGTYVGLRWHQAQKETREEQAKHLFNFKEAEISAFSLKRGKEEIQLTRQGNTWEITKPLKAKADEMMVQNLLQALAPLKMERDLGPGDLKTFGLDRPGLVVSFTGKGKQYQLAVGNPAPGSRGYYARKDETPNILVIGNQARNSLDRQLTALRDKTLWAFKLDQVKSLKVRTDKTQVNLEKSGANVWRWTGKPDFRVRSDRVAQLLRQLSEAQITDFPPAPPKDLKAAGLAPRAKAQVTLITPQGTETLFLGSGTGNWVYARRGAQGPVIQVAKDLPEQISRTVATLEDRRLWSGPIMEVGVVVWGTPGKTWTAVRAKNENFWMITGPDKAEVKQGPTRLEMAFTNFQNLEYSSLLPKAEAPGKDAFTVEFFGPDGQLMFSLKELGKKDAGGLAVFTKTGKTTLAAVISQKKFAQWRAEMARLTTPPPSPASKP